MKKLLMLSFLIISFSSYSMSRLVNKISRTKKIATVLKQTNFKRNICSKSNCIMKGGQPPQHVCFISGFISIPVLYFFYCCIQENKK
jgi:hypothetical protein